MKVNSADRLTYRFSVQATNFRTLCVYKITSAKTCHGVTTQGHMENVSSSGDCIHCKTNNQSLERFSETFRKIVIFIFFLENSENSEKYPLPKNTRSTVYRIRQKDSQNNWIWKNNQSIEYSLQINSQIKLKL